MPQTPDASAESHDLQEARRDGSAKSQLSILCVSSGPVKAGLDCIIRGMSVRALWIGALVLAAAGAAQAPVALSGEPHHRQLIYTGHVRLYEITVGRGESTLDHSHDRDMMTVSLGTPTFRTRRPGEAWSEPRSYVPGSVNIAEYTGAPAVHRMEVTGTTPYRVLAVENLRERGWSMPRMVTGPGTSLVQQSRSFAVYDVKLGTAQPATTHTHQMPTMVILVSGIASVQGGGGESEFKLDAPGRWFASAWDQAHTLTAVGGSAHVVEVEAR